MSAGRLWGCLDDERADARERLAERKFSCYMWEGYTTATRQVRMLMWKATQRHSRPEVRHMRDARLEAGRL